ncbi:MAG: hypothetical protein FJW39_07265 [Acidobacteria bacterium]|nr:hypothetical protein [Acidobacteriota bacterium]
MLSKLRQLRFWHQSSIARTPASAPVLTVLSRRGYHGRVKEYRKMPLGWQETIFIFVLALLVFGPKKLPELGKTIGKAMTEFRRASSELKSTWDREMHALEKETESVREATQQVDNQLQTSYDDGYSYYDSNYEYNQGSTPSNPDGSATVSESASQDAEQTATATASTEVAAAPESTEASPETAPPPPAGAASDSSYKPAAPVSA